MAPNQTSYTHDICDRDGKLFICPLCAKMGTPHTTVNSSNMETHLASKKHGISASHESVATLKAEKIERDRARAREARGPMDQHTKKEAIPEETREVIIWADHFDPLERVESASYRLKRHVIVTKDAMRKACIALGKALLNARLLMFEHEVVGLALDSGTIAHRRYLAIMVCPHRREPFIYKLLTDEDLPGGQQTSVNICGALTGVITELSQKNVTVLTIVADNANNMQSVLAIPAGTIRTRCFAHSIQLAVKAFIAADPQIQQTLQFVREMRDANPSMKIRAEVETRWNYSYLMLEDADKALGFTPTQKGNISTAKAKLESFYIATQVVQHDLCTLFTGLGAISALLAKNDPAIDAAFAATAKYFLSPAVVLLSYLCPSIRQEDFSEAHHLAIAQAITALQPFIEKLSGKQKEGLTNKVVVEKNNYECRTDVIPEEEMSHEKFKNYWKNSGFERLAALAEVVADSPPTESPCERTFSMVKREVGKFRQSMKSDLVLGQLQVHTMWGDLIEDVDVAEVKVAPVATIHASGLRKLLQFSTTRRGRDEEEADAADENCGKCGKSEEEHRGCLWVDCAECGKWYANVCMKSKYKKTMGSFTCGTCKGLPPHAW